MAALLCGIGCASSPPREQGVTKLVLLSESPKPTPAAPDDTEIRTLHALIAETPDTEADEKADLLFRLGVTQAARASQALRQSRDPHRLPPERQALSREARTRVIEALKAFKQIIGDGRLSTYHRMDAVFFQMGRALQEHGYLAEALAAYKRLIKGHPTSPHIADAYLEFARYYADQNDPDTADRFFERAAATFDAIAADPSSAAEQRQAAAASASAARAEQAALR